ncbi:MAG TPA: ABC transporter ATP-binding protein, partial [Alphaproteobacteria bacterium]
DEATSALDPLTESEILRTVAGISRGITVLAISHNPALLNVADHVFKIENGQVREELLRSGKVATI